LLKQGSIISERERETERERDRDRDRERERERDETKKTRMGLSQYFHSAVLPGNLKERLWWVT